MKKIAIVGTGIMGAGMALNFLKAGHEVWVWNRTPDRLQALANKGAKIAASPKAAAAAAEVVFEVTANDESSRAIWTGVDGILAGAEPNTILIASGTFSASWIEELAKLCADKNLSFLDMPLTGGRTGAETGTLTLLVGGDNNNLEELKPDLSAISEKIFYFGPTGSGAKFKLLLQMIQGIHLAAFAEAMKVAQDQHLDLAAVGGALAARMGGTTAMAWRDFGQTADFLNFAVKWILKDLTYAKKFASGASTPFLDDAIKKYQTAMDQGLGEQDWTVIAKS